MAAFVGRGDVFVATMGISTQLYKTEQQAHKWGGFNSEKAIQNAMLHTQIGQNDCTCSKKCVPNAIFSAFHFLLQKVTA
jgi:hypothetical protein